MVCHRPQPVHLILYAVLLGSQSFVMLSARGLPLPKAYPAATGLKPALKGSGNGGLRQQSVKKTGCITAGLYMGIACC